MGHLEALARKPASPSPCRVVGLIHMAARAGRRVLGDVVLSPRNTPFPGVPASSTTPGPIWVLLRDRWGRLSPSHQRQVLSQRPKGGVHVHMCVPMWVHGLISHSQMRTGGAPRAESLLIWMPDYRLRPCSNRQADHYYPPLLLRGSGPPLLTGSLSLSLQSSLALPRRSMSISRTQMGEL